MDIFNPKGLKIPQEDLDKKEMALKIDNIAIQDIIKRHGVLDAYSMFFDSCDDQQLALLLQHQVRFFEALSNGEDLEKNNGGKIIMMPPKSKD